MAINPIAANIPDDVLEKLAPKWRPSASVPNDEPTARRTAHGKSLTGAQSKQIKVPGTTSAMRTRGGNPQRDKQGRRQVTAYRANRIAQNTLQTKSTTPLPPTTKEEVRDRLLNPNNRHHTGNPVIINNTVVK